MNLYSKTVCSLFAAALLAAVSARPAEAAGLSADLDIKKKSVGSNKYSLTLTMTAKVTPNGPMATFQVSQITIAKPTDPSKGTKVNLPPVKNGLFTVTGYVEWKGNKISWVSTVKITVGTQNLTLTRTETITVN